ncbi:MAG: metal ABC transporter permease, partial [Planctomycetota bacterium]
THEVDASFPSRENLPQEGGRSHLEPRWPYGGRGKRDRQTGGPAVQVAALQVRYPGAADPAIRDASLEVPCGRRVALVGHNGAGKSTLLKAIAGLLKSQAGSIRLFGNPVDPHHAQTIGLSEQRIRYLLLVILALAIVAGIQSVGVVMTTALMVTPAAAGSLITRQLGGMLVWTAVVSILSNCIGLYASYYLSVLSGGTIVLSCTALFGVISLGNHLRRFRRSANRIAYTCEWRTTLSSSLRTIAEIARRANCRSS